MLSIIVVAYHGTNDLRACLEHAGERWPVYVVDNSSDPAVREVAGKCRATYLENSGNLGFAAGVNLGLAHVDREHDVLLLNPDAVIDGAAIRRLHERLRSAADIAAVSPSLVDARGRAQRVAWPFPTPTRQWREALGLGGSPAAAGEFLVGAVLMLKRAAIDDVGSFDERFFLYAEETDWQRRATYRGWGFEVAPEIEALHLGGGTSSDSDQRRALFHAGAETYMRKWYGRQGWTSYRCAVIVGAAARVMILQGERRAEARAHLRLYLAGPQRAAVLASVAYRAHLV